MKIITIYKIKAVVISQPRQQHFTRYLYQVKKFHKKTVIIWWICLTYESLFSFHIPNLKIWLVLTVERISKDEGLTYVILVNYEICRH